MWWKDGVIYQIYPRSFRDYNGDGVGDLKGITAMLDYLNDGTERSLGVDGIWISPFFRSPMRDFGYDISDYRDIDPIFGTLDDFRLLLSEAHQRGIHIIIDMVLNHTSDEHPWFRESRQDKSNPKADWYIWHPGINGKAPNNWFAQFELKNAWWYEPKRGEFYLGTFTRHQPEVNWRNPGLRQEMFDLARYWLDMGVDGFRLDVINWFIKDDQFRSNPFSFKSVDFQKHVYDRNRPETIEICRELRAITDSYEDRMMVGEVFTDDPAAASQYYGNDDGLHMAFNFNFLFQPWNARKIYKSIAQWYENLPASAWPNFTFSNHDNLRHCYRYRHGKDTDARARVAAALLMTLRGTPFIYYGEELGMTGSGLRRGELKDPLSRRTWPLRRFCRDMARTPMQWDDSPDAGFSGADAGCLRTGARTDANGVSISAAHDLAKTEAAACSSAATDTDCSWAAVAGTGIKPWLPVAKDYQSKNVKLQSQDEASLLSFYRRLIWLRKKHKILQDGGIRFFEKNLPDALVYLREEGAERMLVILNFSEKNLLVSQIVSFISDSDSRNNPETRDTTALVLLGTHRRYGQTLKLSEPIPIKSYEVLIAQL